MADQSKCFRLNGVDYTYQELIEKLKPEITVSEVATQVESQNKATGLVNSILQPSPPPQNKGKSFGSKVNFTPNAIQESVAQKILDIKAIELSETGYKGLENSRRASSAGKQKKEVVDTSKFTKAELEIYNLQQAQTERKLAIGTFLDAVGRDIISDNNFFVNGLHQNKDQKALRVKSVRDSIEKFNNQKGEVLIDPDLAVDIVNAFITLKSRWASEDADGNSYYLISPNGTFFGDLIDTDGVTPWVGSMDFVAIDQNGKISPVDLKSGMNSSNLDPNNPISIGYKSQLSIDASLLKAYGIEVTEKGYIANLVVREDEIKFENGKGKPFDLNVQEGTWGKKPTPNQSEIADLEENNTSQESTSAAGNQADEINIDDAALSVFTEKLDEGLSQQEIEWTKATFPGAPITIIDRLIKMPDGKYAEGMYINGAITLSSWGNRGVAYHEAFHLVEDLLLTKEERQSLYDEVGGDNPSEVLAEQFRAYMIDADNLVNKYGKVGKFFVVVKGFINALLSPIIGDRYSVFYKIRVGAYTNRTGYSNFESDSQNTTRFSEYIFQPINEKDKKHLFSQEKNEIIQNLVYNLYTNDLDLTEVGDKKSDEHLAARNYSEAIIKKVIGAYKVKYPTYAVIWENALKDFEDLMKGVVEYIDKLNITKADSEDLTENSDDDTDINVGNESSDNVLGKSNNEYSSRKNAAAEMKLMTKLIKGDTVSKLTGTKGFLDYGQVWTTLSETLCDVVDPGAGSQLKSIMIQKLQDVAVAKPWLNSIIEKLNTGSESFSRLFLNTFQKQKISYVQTNTRRTYSSWANDYVTRYSVFDPAFSKPENQIRSQVTNAIVSLFTEDDGASFNDNDSDDVTVTGNSKYRKEEEALAIIKDVENDVQILIDSFTNDYPAFLDNGSNFFNKYLGLDYNKEQIETLRQEVNISKRTKKSVFNILTTVLIEHVDAIKPDIEFNKEERIRAKKANEVPNLKSPKPVVTFAKLNNVLGHLVRISNLSADVNISGTNGTKYAIVQNTFLSKMFNKLNSDKYNFSNYKNNYFAKGSLLLSNFENPQQLLRNSLHVHNLMQKGDKKVELKEASFKDEVIERIMLRLHKKDELRKTGTLTVADKPIPNFIHSSSDHHFNGLQSTIYQSVKEMGDVRKTLLLEFRQWLISEPIMMIKISKLLRAEYERQVLYGNVETGLTDFDNNKNKFILFNELNVTAKEYATIENKQNRTSTEELILELYNVEGDSMVLNTTFDYESPAATEYVADKIIHRVGITYDTLKEMDVHKHLVKSEIGVNFMRFDDDKITDKKVKTIYQNFNISAAFSMMSMNDHIEYMQMFTGDPAMYKNIADYMKRTPSGVAPGSDSVILNKEDETFNIVVLKPGKMGKGKDTGYSKDDMIAALNENYRKALMAELKSEAKVKAAMSPYENFDETDGVSLITPKRWKQIMIIQGKWKPKYEKPYQRLLRGEAVGHKELPYGQPIKGMHFELKPHTFPGNHGEVHTLMVPTYLKYAQTVLWPSLTKGNAILEKLSADMDANNIDEAVFNSAIKAGAMKPVSVSNIASTKPITLHNEFYKIQQDMPSKYMKNHEANRGSQVETLIMGDLDLDGDFLFQGKTIKGNILSKEMKDIDEELTDLGVNQLMKQWGLYRDGEKDTVLRKDHGNKFSKKFFGDLAEKMKRDDAPVYLVNALNNLKNADPKALRNVLDMFPLYRDKILSHIFTTITKTTVKGTMEGGAFIQASGFGIEYDTKMITDQDLFDDGDIIYFDKALKGPDCVFDKNGKVVEVKSAQVFVPQNFITPEFLTENDCYTNGKIDGKKLKQVLVDLNVLDNLVGYRIPTQGMSSIDSIEIAGILPQHYGDTVYVYTNNPAKTGADFDIDKMFIMMPHRYTTEEAAFLNAIAESRVDSSSEMLAYVKQRLTKNHEERAALRDGERPKTSITPTVKKGVSELFESNPELANAVYEALGFNPSMKETVASKNINEKFLDDSKGLIDYLKSNFKGFDFLFPFINRYDIKLDIQSNFSINNNFASGGYNWITNTIVFDKDLFFQSDTFERTLLHEIIHGILRNKYAEQSGKKTLNQQEFKVDVDNYIKNILPQLKEAGKNNKRLNDIYEIIQENPEEVITYGLTDKEFINFLKTTPSNLTSTIREVHKTNTLWDIFYDIISKIFGKSNLTRNKLEELTDLLNDVLEVNYIENGFTFNNIEYQQITPQQKQQAQQLYSQYLDTIFPDSKVKEVLYHMTSIAGKKGIEEKGRFLKPGEEGYQKRDYATTGGIYFTDNNNYDEDTEMYGSPISGAYGSAYVSAILNIKNPLIDLNRSFGDISKVELKDHDGFVGTNESKEIGVLEPEQIHILGSKQDIEGFKKSLTQTDSKQYAEDTKRLNTERKILESIYEKSLKNRKLDVYSSVLKNPKTFAKNIKPLDTPDLKNNAYVIKYIIDPRGYGALSLKKQNEFKNKSDLKKYEEADAFYDSQKLEPLELVSIEYQLNSKKGFSSSKSGVATVANHITSNSLVQRAKISIDGVQSHYQHADSDGFAELFNYTDTKDRSGRYISDVLSAYLNANVDAAKDNYIGEINMNQITLSPAMYMIRTGYPLEFVNAFMANPVIKAYAEVRTDAKAFYSTYSSNNMESAMQKLYPKFSLPSDYGKSENQKMLKKQRQGEFYKLTTAQLTNMLMGKPTQEESLMMMEAMVAILGSSKKLTNIVGIKLNVEGMGKNFSKRIITKTKIKRVMSDASIKNGSLLFTNTSMGAFHKNSFELFDQSLADLSIVTSKAAEEVYDVLLKYKEATDKDLYENEVKDVSKTLTVMMGMSRIDKDALDTAMNDFWPNRKRIDEDGQPIDNIKNILYNRHELVEYLKTMKMLAAGVKSPFFLRSKLSVHTKDSMSTIGVALGVNDDLSFDDTQMSYRELVNIAKTPGNEKLRSGLIILEAISVLNSGTLKGLTTFYNLIENSPIALKSVDDVAKKFVISNVDTVLANYFNLFGQASLMKFKTKEEGLSESTNRGIKYFKTSDEIYVVKSFENKTIAEKLSSNNYNDVKVKRYSLVTNDLKSNATILRDKDDATKYIYQRNGVTLNFRLKEGMYSLLKADGTMSTTVTENIDTYLSNDNNLKLSVLTQTMKC